MGKFPLREAGISERRNQPRCERGLPATTWPRVPEPGAWGRRGPAWSLPKEGPVHKIRLMKAKLASGVFLIVAIGLGLGWFLHVKQLRAEREELLTKVAALTADLQQARSNASEATQEKTDLGHRLEALTTQLKNASNDLSVATAGLADARTAAAAAARLAEVEINQREARIAELEVTNKDLDRQAAEAREMLAGLEARITDTERQLAAAEGDRDFLMRELQRLQTEKADIERRFNDLVVLRAQVRKLQTELAADSQLDAIREGLSQSRRLKGAELLRRGFPAHRQDEASAEVDLDVEIRRDGSSTIEQR